MKFHNEQNEDFWRNISRKHKLTQQEYRVLIEFVTDRETFDVAISVLSERLNLKATHVSRSLKSLVLLDILIQPNGKYELNPAVLTAEYQAKAISSTEARKMKESTYIKGNGDFKKQSQNKKSKLVEYTNNIKKMTQETKAKNSSKEISDTVSADELSQISESLNESFSETDVEHYNFKPMEIDNDTVVLDETRKVRCVKRHTLPTLSNAIKFLRVNNVSTIHWLKFLSAQTKNELMNLVKTREELLQPLKSVQVSAIVEDTMESTGDTELDELLKKI